MLSCRPKAAQAAAGAEANCVDPAAVQAALDAARAVQADAAQVLPELEGPFDLIFMDAAKGQYIRFLPEVIRLLRPGGVLLSDNVLKEGEILQSKFAVTRRNRTIHKRMREYLTAISDDPRLRTVLLETGDGAALSVRRRSAGTEEDGPTGSSRQ